ncbi:MAG: acyl-protein synthetase [Christensenellaceae bacterium]|jgi:hypothetical protein
MFEIEEILKIPPYSLASKQKAALYEDAMGDLTAFHRAHCAPYRRMVDALGATGKKEADVPFFPVRLFKDYELLSVEKSEVVKTMTSSGTSGQAVSKIFLDRKTSSAQTKALTKITGEFLGKKRLPMLVLDSKAVLKDRQMFSARGAGILGFSMLGHDVTYALNEQMELDFGVLDAFLEKHAGEDMMLFGFTYIVWAHFYKALLDADKKYDLSNGILIHGGGFKKLQEEAVSNEEFKQRLKDACGLARVYNYYGMVEQTGSIFMECEHGRLHASVFSDVIIRRADDFSECGVGERGLIQLLSLLPHSYPGHSILTEDEGEITGIDDCPCGRLGKTIKIHGRIQNAEARGCSDTYERK